MKKITVMIVDDERLAIDDLMTIVDWEANGFEIIATAVNGKQALSKFKELHPQVVLTDIKMPYMDGIEFIGCLREIDTKTKVVLLTAYKDFSYAKSAIQHGISDYLIKSEISSTSVTDLLNRLRGMIGTEDKDSDILKQKRIADYFNADASDKTPGESAEDRDFLTASHRYLIIEQDLPLNISGFDFLNRDESQRNRLMTILKANTDSDFTITALSGIRYDRVLAVLDTGKLSRTDSRGKLYDYARALRTQLAAEFSCSFTFFTVDMKMNLAELKKLYMRSADCFHTKYFSEAGAILEIRQVPQTHPQSDIRVDEKLLGGMSVSMDEDGVCMYIEGQFDRVKDNYAGLYGISRTLYDTLRKYIDQLPDDASRPDISAENNSLYWLNSLSLCQWFCMRFRDMIREKKKAYERGYSKAVIRSISFINENFRKSDLNINQIADEVHLSAGHLCSLFKKETGTTLKDYVTDLRIAAAKKLLRESSMKIYEISEAVGYQSSQYFSQVFFKKEGLQPVEYQKGRIGSEG